MGFFGNKEDKKEQEIQKFIAKYKLNDIDQNDLEMIREISSDLFGTELLKAAANNAESKYLSVLVKQNWILIRKLDEISKKLDK